MADFILKQTAQTAGIPMQDALIGIYAAYYIGSHDREVKDHLNYNFNLRARNTFNMTGAMNAAFGQEDSPWVVLDHLSDARRDSQNNGQELSGAHFITLFHRASGQVMIAMPGLESDDGIGDIIDDFKQMAFGGMRGQSAALYAYTKHIEEQIAAGAFKGADGKALPITTKPVIGAHSMGCTAAQMMVLDGYDAVLLEPRPVHKGLLNRLTDNLARITGAARMTHDAALERLDAATTNIRTSHSNLWNSIILPWVKQHGVGTNYAYGVEGHELNVLDRTILTSHRVEESATQPYPQAKCHRSSMFFTEASADAHRPLLADVSKRDKNVSKDKVLKPT